MSLDPLAGSSPNRPASKIRPGPVLLNVADVKPATVQWLWPGRFPLGKVSLIAGDPGKGKSTLTLDLAARVTTGASWPDARDVPMPVGGVVLLSGEDDPADTIRPRLDAAGADCSRINILRGVRRVEGGDVCFFTLDEMPTLDDAIRQTRDCRLVIIDPVTCYYPGSTDSHRTTDVRALIAPLADVAAATGAAIVLVSHLNKGGTGKATYRITGSLALPAAARAVHLVTPDRDDPSRRLILPVKMNLSADNGGLAFTLSGDPPCVEWFDGPVNVSADDALAVVSDGDGGERGEVNGAADFLRELLGAQSLPAREVEAQAKAAGYTLSTLRRAKGRAGVVVLRHGFGPGGGWVWSIARPPDGA